MGTSFEDIMKRMKSTPHVGVPAVTNPKLPTKVERETEAATVRRKAMPNFHFGNGNKMEQLVEHMKTAPHPTPNYADSKFINNDKELLEAIKADFQAYIKSASANGVF